MTGQADIEQRKLERLGKRFVGVCPLSELPVGDSVVVRLEGDDIAVFHRQQGIFAVSNFCVHQHVSVLV
ncbi:MAG: nitrite reductase (NAD(P)H) small subunit, partial [Candidatus Kapabacteria bacterium]|nr:nitrite reductase (NAD(P)H) small subunit [Candidatus Kapabacteria bacterium]MDW8226039.1 nitrite reductase (NAD(P)H) small subunit [Bacteroidota bacterium]